jgi:hypothetical protein
VQAGLAINRRKREEVQLHSYNTQRGCSGADARSRTERISKVQ